MKILKEGDLDRMLRIMRFECPKCGCIFEANRNEYKYEFSQRENYGWYSIKCPTCNFWVTKKD